MSKVVGERLKHIRLKLGLSQEKFGFSLNHSGRSFISHLENGSKPVPESIKSALISVYHVNLDYLENGKAPMFLDVRKDDNLLLVLGSLIARDSEAARIKLLEELITMTDEQCDSLYQIIVLLKESKFGVSDLSLIKNII